jgi:PncC family amidohydrolase
MAEGACAALGADCGVSITGIAGPAGGTEEKPVGTVWTGLVLRGRAEARLFRLFGDRSEIRARAAQAALAFLLTALRTEDA